MAASDLHKAKIAQAVQKPVENPPAPTAVAAPVVTAPHPAPAMNPVAAMLLKKAQVAQALLDPAKVDPKAAPAGATATGVQGHVGVLPSDAPAQGVGIPAVSDVLATEVSEDLTADASPASQAGSGTIETTEAKAKRGRRTKAQMEADRAAAEAAGTKITEVVSGTLPAGFKAQVMGAMEAALAPAVSTKPAGFTLCLGCAPVSGGANPVALEFVIATLLEKAAQQAGIANIHVLDYGKKASMVTEALKAHQFTAPLYTFTTNDAFLEGIIVSVLSTKAALIIRGAK